MSTDVDAGLEYARRELGWPASGWRVDNEHGAYWAFSPTHAVDGLVIVGRDAQELVARVRTQVRVLALAADVYGALPPGGVLCGIAFQDPPPPRDDAPRANAPPAQEVRPGVYRVRPLPTEEAPQLAAGSEYVSKDRTVVIGHGNPPPPAWAERMAARPAPEGPRPVVTVPLRLPGPVAKGQRPQTVRLPTSISREVATTSGYLGDPCGECQQFTMVQNGACQKCTSCGATTGCS